MNRLHILLLDDEENTRRSLSTFLMMHGYDVTTAEKASEALERLRNGRFHAVLSDVKMPGMDGITFAEKVKENFPSVTILIMSAFGNVRDAVEAMKKGAYDYMTKPLDHDELLVRLAKIADHYALIEEVKGLRKRLGAESPYAGIVGVSSAMRNVYRFIETAAASDYGVLITGETGTGKDLVARAIHHNSARKTGPFVPVSCGALPETLLESELFGHVRGAFTGAVGERMGKIRSADGGILFLDEVGTLSPSAQVKLLRVIEKKQFEPLGGDHTVTVDIRIIAATNEDLSRAVSEGRFREDLFYRLNVLHMELPPLREHREDIPLLVRHILEKLGRKEVTVSSGAMDILLRYHWPGNVRELENAIETALVRARGDTLLMEYLPPSLGPRRLDAATSLRDKMAMFERYLIEEKLIQTEGNVTRAARELAFPLRSLRRKLEKYSINPKDYKKSKRRRKWTARDRSQEYAPDNIPE